MTPPIYGPSYIPPLDIHWILELDGWNLMVNKKPEFKDIYLTYDETANPPKRILRWNGKNWEISPLDVARHVIAWKELEDSLSTSEEECEISPENKITSLQ